MRDKDEKLFIPRFSANAPPSDSLDGMTEEERRTIRERPHVREYLKAAEDDRKRRKQIAHRQWWASNWLQVVCAVFAFISALPPIISFINWIISLAS